ncbi:MAG: hypothetical protein K2Y29_04270 [Beijerinckiaceae bacterium]|nr:hypothetical protein [Beijerinckiaceae bacterium]
MSDAGAQDKQDTLEAALLDSMDFDEIEAAVMETERGRWFLQEYARRLRESDNSRIEAALARIESRLPIAPNPVREAETRIVALSVHQRLVDLARSLRERGVDEDSCTRIEAQAAALVELARRRNLIETPVQAASSPTQSAETATPRQLPAA